LKQLAAEVMNDLQKTAGTDLYVSVYQNIHQKATDLRRERKEKRVNINITDPKLRAQQKLKKNILKQKSRKRKHEEYENKKLRFGITKKLR
jgi:hypothetical protein